ncbi:hypothetical protein PQR05_29305 [Paraburkholderia sediminicola]|uniref:hypothetical protein n=1 Tax=Paraburkholderia sediminicola TaxID=458836 RepID=UPI0038B94D72
MGKKTGKITYNVHARGRSKSVGCDRRFDLRVLAALVNGEEVQERVKNRDLKGFYGHVVRMKYGFQPPEMVVEDGKPIYIEPAVVTTHLSADDEGNITHDTEFLDTVPGEMAERLHNSRHGGFSSAIFAKPRGPVDVPLIFSGFDYVYEPNYTTNRGYRLDSTGGGMDGLILDAVMADWTAGTAAMKALYDSIERDHMLALQTLDRMREENEELLSLLSARGTDNATGVIVLDSTGGEQARPMIVSKRATSQFARNASAFQSASLVGFDRLPDDKADVADDATLIAAKQRYGV